MCSHSELISSILKDGDSYHELRAVTSLLAVLKSGGKQDFDKVTFPVMLLITLVLEGRKYWDFLTTLNIANVGEQRVVMRAWGMNGPFYAEEIWQMRHLS